MTTLIAIYNNDGLVGRCDSRCYNARGPRCTCICGGVNHGVGLNRAVENTQAIEAVIEEYCEDHDDGESLHWKVPAQEPVQLTLL